MIPVPRGFRFGAAQAGFKKKDRFDLALAVSDAPAVAAGVFTTNLFKAAPVLECMDLLAAGRPLRAVLANSGQANACTGEEGRANCRETLAIAARAAGVDADGILPASTGVIGQHLRMDLWRDAAGELKKNLGRHGPMEFAKAIMTTDSFPKLAWGGVQGPDGREIRLLGVAKGAGMICPDMATMLGFVFCDAEVDPADWRALINNAADQSFNRVTVDGDTSTNDTLLGLANGASCLRAEGELLPALAEALTDICQALAYMIVQDAEGGTKVARIVVTGAEDKSQAEMAARAVGNSPLVKTALFGRDANWGRIVAALGRSGARFDPDAVRLAISGITIFENGTPVPGDMDSLLEPHMRRQDVDISVNLGRGEGAYSLLASDLTEEYIRINALYRT